LGLKSYFSKLTIKNKMSNLPDNVSEHDPKAPWNRKETEYLIIKREKWKHETEVIISIDGRNRCVYVPEPDASKMKSDNDFIDYIKTFLL
jgi:hypothetical protein